MGPRESAAAQNQKRRYGAAGYFAIDETPKRKPGAALKRLANLQENPFAALVVDRYDDDWTHLGWVMVQGHAEILASGPEHTTAPRPPSAPAIPSSPQCASNTFR